MENKQDFVIQDGVLTEYNGPGGDVVIPAGVTKIGYWAFSGCTGLTSVTILAELETVGKYLFEDSRPVLVAPHISIVKFDKEDKPGACVGFAKAYLDGAELDEEIKAGYLKHIKNHKKKLYPVAVKHEELLRLMFTEKYVTRKDIDILLEECDNQNNVTAKAAVLDYAGKNLKPVDSFAEMEKELAKAERIAAHLEKTGSLPIGELKKRWSWKTKDTENGTFVTLTNWKGKDGPCVTVPAKIGENPVKAIGEAAFSPKEKPKAIREARETLQSVTIPAGVTEIREGAFYGCASLTSVTIPQSVTEIGLEAFYGCASLTSVTVPKSMTKIDREMFEDCRPAIIAPHIPVAGFDAADKPGACAGFAKAYLDGMELDGEIKAGYLKYIKGQRTRLYPLAVKHEALLRVMLAEKMIPRKDVDLLLEECDTQNNIAAKAAVLDYAGKNLKPVDPLKEFKLKGL